MTWRRGPVIARTMTDATSPTAPPEVLPDGAIPAATLVIMRPSDGGGPDEILMVKRSAKMAFAAGAVVFPGGRVDPDDYRVARLYRSEEHTSELQSLMRISYAVFCLHKKNTT